MTPSQSLTSPVATSWLETITDMEQDINSLLSLIAPDLLQAGMEAIKTLKKSNKDHDNLQLWPTAFSAIGVIVNRKTLAHRDQGGWKSCFDILVAAGTYKECYLEVADAGASFEYKPGTAIAICGKLLRHSVPRWNGGERICYAHYMRNNVHNRLQVEQSGWNKYSNYTQFMSRKFVHRTSGNRW
jgi:hypothetical protein